MADTVRLAEMLWAEAKAAAGAGRAVIIPFGSIEQHGPHLPLATDSINVEELCKRAAERTNSVLAPTQVYGVSHNHIDFAGTMTIEPETLIAIVQDLVASLYHHGFRRILLVNGHGGNNDTLEVAALKARRRFPDALVGHAYSGALHRAGHQHLRTDYVYHADEGETAEVMALRPDLVRAEAAQRVATETFDWYYHRYYHGSREGNLFGLVTYGLPPTQVLTPNGIMGDATGADAEQGERYLEAAVGSLVRVVEDLLQRPIHTTDPNRRP